MAHYCDGQNHRSIKTGRNGIAQLHHITDVSNE